MIPYMKMVMKYFKLKKKKCKILSKNVFSYNKDNIKKVFILENGLVSVFERKINCIILTKYLFSEDDVKTGDYKEIIHSTIEEDIRYREYCEAI